MTTDLDLDLSFLFLLFIFLLAHTSADKNEKNSIAKEREKHDTMKLDLSSLPTFREVADAVVSVAPLRLAVGAVLVFGAGKLIPRYEDSYKTWYPSLKKPSWNPPGYVFPMVWIPLKLCQSAAVAIVGEAAAADIKTGSGGTGASPVERLTELASSASSSKAVRALAVFAGMTALGNYWNVTFFGRRQMKKSTRVMAAFWASVAATIWAFGEVDNKAGALVAPTIVWVTIATALNFTIVKLNPGQGAKED